MNTSVALNGPLKGKAYTITSDITKTIIDHFRTMEGIYEVTYKRVENGWSCESVTPLTPLINDREFKKILKDMNGQ